jgi:parallel beta-helix repeat protein
MRSSLSKTAGLFAALVSIVSLSTAGDLEPPGVPGSTPGPEPRTPISAATTPGDANSVFRITEPGSYYLTRDVGPFVFAGGFNGIEIAASHVTLDLNGFTLNGSLTLFPTAEAALLSPTLNGIAASPEVSDITIRNGNVVSWGDNGVELASVPAVQLQGITSSGNGSDGFELGFDGVVQDCIARDNANSGFKLAPGLIVENCVAAANSFVGFLFAGGPGRISHCLAEDNGTVGFYQSAGGDWLLVENVASRNGSDGISVCGTTVILRNHCVGNGSAPAVTGAGIQVRCGNNRVEGNYVRGNDVGIEAFEGGGEIVIRNTAADNTDANYQGTAGNDFGPIVSSAAAATHPLANISH